MSTYSLNLLRIICISGIDSTCSPFDGTKAKRKCSSVNNKKKELSLTELASNVSDLREECKQICEEEMLNGCCEYHEKEVLCVFYVQGRIIDGPNDTFAVPCMLGKLLKVFVLYLCNIFT